MKKQYQLGGILLALVMTIGLLAGCTSANQSSSSTQELPQSQSAAAESSVAESTPAQPQADINIGGLKGPTAMGMVQLMEQNEQGLAANHYTFTLAGTADEISAKIVKGELDIAAVPANLASVLYNKTEGKVKVLAINTLGVLYLVESGDSIHSVADLKGKTIYTVGKGTTPEYSLNYILTKNGLTPGTDVTVEFKSEATELAALLSQDAAAIAMLPEPFVTSALAQNDKLRVALNVGEEWQKVSGAEGGKLVTGTVIVRQDFLEAHEDAVDAFLQEYKASIDFVNSDLDAASALVEKYGIVAKAALAKKAIPNCSIVYIDGSDMKADLTGYLSVLLAANPQSVGGKLPDENFYYQR